MKTKNLLFSLLLVGAVGITGAQAQKPKPKLAVLVVGMESAAKSDDFAARLGSDLNRNGEYELVTASDAVATKLDALRTQTTPVDTTGLAAWGRENGIDLVQLVVQVSDYGGMKTSRVAQLVDCSTGNLSGRGTYRMDFTPKGFDVNTVIELVAVTGGVFEMGCKSGRDSTCYNDQKPLHYVKVNDFHIGKYPVTQAQWQAVMGWELPEGLIWAHRGDSKPVINLNHDAIVGTNGFLAKLNALTGKSYRLPTEAEWEYAARGCSAGVCDTFLYSGSNTIGDVAWYFIDNFNPNNPEGPQPVGTKSPNALGIYDMSGNVLEWCSDWYSNSYYPSGTTQTSPQNNPTGPTSGSYRVQRGGSWMDINLGCRAVHRIHSGVASDENCEYCDDFGFRLVLP